MDNSTKRKPKGDVKFNIVLNEEQKLAKELIIQKPINFLMGRAGSGKTALATQIALDLFFTRQVEKIVITRPTVSSEENGFLPGTIQEKMDPWLVPIRDNMNKAYNAEKVKQLEADKKIELCALTHFRGRTFERSVIIVDEFENLTETQLIMCLGRLGKESKMIFCGDLDQIDLSTRFKSVGTILSILKKSDHITFIELKENHRHEVLSDVFKLIEEYRK